MKDKALMQLLLKLHTEFPNNTQFGEEIRKIVWQYIQDNNPAY